MKSVMHPVAKDFKRIQMYQMLNGCFKIISNFVDGFTVQLIIKDLRIKSYYKMKNIFDSENSSFMKKSLLIVLRK